MTMTDQLSVPYLEILMSRILHDLVSPVSAVNNGVEFLRDMGDDMGDEALELLATSANQASVRLQAFRLAYGAGGSEDMVSGKMIYEAYRNFIDPNRFSLSWDLMNHVPDDPRKGYFKILINALILMLDFAPKGGEVSVTMQGDETSVILKSDMILIKDDMRDLLAGNEGEVSAKTIHAYALGLYAHCYQFRTQLVEADDLLKIVITNS